MEGQWLIRKVSNGFIVIAPTGEEYIAASAYAISNIIDEHYMKGEENHE